ncbi:putative cancer susceptibility gene HEPN1 protein [Trichechus manatus latirostris]|uniref:Cancer susceptibility gene HEPN1 protein n=1 Tax=Trichechus manatus latirostris TaxID=127582 RepID=A0A2Y9FXK5_TRIMA|nr:putative cancer susceptibility gene HEPN1 protein [Trichechus manatus latirostris]
MNGGGESELEFRRLGRGQGCEDPLEASGRRRQNTQRAFLSFSFLIVPPHTADHCVSCELYTWQWLGAAAEGPGPDPLYSDG